MGTTPHDTSLYEDILAEYKDCLENMPVEPERLLTGEEIMKLTGLKPGPELGKIIAELRHEQLDEKIKTKEEALGWVKGNHIH
mgnify:CR=1 FL=1